MLGKLSAAFFVWGIGGVAGGVGALPPSCALPRDIWTTVNGLGAVLGIELAEDKGEIIAQLEAFFGAEEGAELDFMRGVFEAAFEGEVVFDRAAIGADGEAQPVGVGLENLIRGARVGAGEDQVIGPDVDRFAKAATVAFLQGEPEGGEDA